MDQLVELADSNTAAILMVNQGNPCGSVYSYHHLAQIAKVAERLRAPIIADEVYADMAFGRHKFVPVAEFPQSVPSLTVGAVSKRWLAPGWRLGWIAVCDPRGILTEAQVGRLRPPAHPSLEKVFTNPSIPSRGLGAIVLDG